MVLPWLLGVRDTPVTAIRRWSRNSLAACLMPCISTSSLVLAVGGVLSARTRPTRSHEEHHLHLAAPGRPLDRGDRPTGAGPKVPVGTICMSRTGIRSAAGEFPAARAG